MLRIPVAVLPPVPVTAIEPVAPVPTVPWPRNTPTLSLLAPDPPPKPVSVMLPAPLVTTFAVPVVLPMLMP